MENKIPVKLNLHSEIFMEELKGKKKMMTEERRKIPLLIRSQQ